MNPIIPVNGRERGEEGKERDLKRDSERTLSRCRESRVLETTEKNQKLQRRQKSREDPKQGKPQTFLMTSHREEFRMLDCILPQAPTFPRNLRVGIPQCLSVRNVVGTLKSLVSYLYTHTLPRGVKLLIS